MQDIPKLLIHDLNMETKRRRKNQQNHRIDIPRPKWAQYGVQTTCDMPTDTTWQHEVFNRTGVFYPVNENYVCKCGQEYNSSFPPPVCFKCKRISPIEDKRFINMKR